MHGTVENGVIGIDGGGSGCRAILVQGGHRFECSGKAANVTTDFNGAMRVLKDVLEALRAKAGLEESRMRALPAHLGLAGVLDDARARAVVDALPLENVVVTDDRVTSTIGALAGDNGAVAGIGTGSFLAAARGHDMRFIGGWGLILGDEASGAWLGRGLLSAALRTLDGLVKPTALSNAILRELDGAAGLVAFARGAMPADFAAFAPRVTVAAAEGDLISAGLMREGALYIAAALQTLDWAPGERLCLIGGLGPGYAPYLPLEIRACVTEASGTALDGAVRLASLRLGPIS